MCKLASETQASIVNFRVTSARLHANACSLASVEHTSGAWDIASGDTVPVFRLPTSYESCHKTQV